MTGDNQHTPKMSPEATAECLLVLAQNMRKAPIPQLHAVVRELCEPEYKDSEACKLGQQIARERGYPLPDDRPAE